MNIAILGGGNLGTLLAGELSARGHSVRVRASDPEAWPGPVDVLDAGGGKLMTGTPDLVSSDYGACMAGAEVVLVTYPLHMLGSVAEELVPLVEPGQLVGAVPGACAEFLLGDVVRRGAVLFGFQRVHSIARLERRGRSVRMLGRKPGVGIAAIPASESGRAARVAGALLEMESTSLPNYLVETLTPSNPILHTARIRAMFAGWEPGGSYARNVLFYEEWDDASSHLLLACDAELQSLCRSLEGQLGVDLTPVRSLKEHYGCVDAAAMTAKISGIPAFRGIASPMVEVGEGRWAPDFGSRYFKSDFAFGLKAIVDMASLAGVEVPAMRDVLGWYARVSGDSGGMEAVPDTLDGLAALYV